MNVIKMENWLPLFLQKHLERDRFLSHLFPLNVCIMNLSYSFISSRRTTKEWQLGCKDGSGGLWLVFAWFCKNAVEHGGSFSTKETARQNLCLSPMFMLPQRVPFLWYIYIYIFQNKQTIRPPKLMSPMNIWRWSRWCQFFCILLATVSDYFNSIFPWFGQNSEVKSASSAKEVDEYLSRHTLNQRFAGWFCLHIVPLVSVAQNSTKRMAIGPGLFAPDVGVNQVQWSIKQRKRLEYL